MRIAIFDSWNGKFSSSIVEHWRNSGHVVRVNPTWEETVGAELNFFYQADNVAVEATTNKTLTGKVFVQCVDIEVWAGQASAVNWSKVDGAIFMAKHIQRMVPLPIDNVALIKPGINLNKWTMRPPKDPGDPTRKIAYIVGDKRIWDVKRLDTAFQLLRDLMDTDTNHIWQLHVRGTYSSHAQYNAYCQYLQNDLGLDDNVVWYPDRIEDMNAWLDDKDYYLNPSTKEAFSYATAETMAKGIKPIINNWESSHETWDPFVCRTYANMLVEFLRGENTPEKYRSFVETHYDEERYFRELDGFMGLKGGEQSAK